MSNETMRAVRAHDYGAADQLGLENAPIPQPGPGEVRIRVLSAAVNWMDSGLRSGAYKQYMPLTFPGTPGREGAGVVEALGEGVTTFKPRQAGFCLVNSSYPDYPVASAGDLALHPANLALDEA